MSFWFICELKDPFKPDFSMYIFLSIYVYLINFMSSLPCMLIFLKVECSNPSLLPEPGQRRSIEEPIVKVVSWTWVVHMLLNYPRYGIMVKLLKL